MLFMVIERFRDNNMVPIYRRVRDGGRLIPEGLRYIDSWVEPNFSRALKWHGSGASIEIVPVVSSKDTREVVAPYLDGN